MTAKKYASPEDAAKVAKVFDEYRMSFVQMQPGQMQQGAPGQGPQGPAQ